MRTLTPGEVRSLHAVFAPERPGPIVGMHVLRTGVGRVRVDRWPDPGVVVAEVASNYALHGAPHDLSAFALDGYVEAPGEFEAAVRAAYARCVVWPRVIQSLRGALASVATPVGYVVRRLRAGDVALPEEMAWVAGTWGGPRGLAESGFGVGAFYGERLVSVACTFFLGEQFEDIGVATDLAHRRRGLSAACAHLLCEDILARGHVPSWSTSPDNTASLGVAARLGFSLERHDRLLVVNRMPPT